VNRALRKIRASWKFSGTQPLRCLATGPTITIARVCVCVYVKVNVWTGPEDSRRLRLPDFETVGTWMWYGCQSYAPAAFTAKLSQPQGLGAARSIMSMKKFQWHHRESNPRPTCSAVPQPTAPLRALMYVCVFISIHLSICIFLYLYLSIYIYLSIYVYIYIYAYILYIYI